MVKKAPYKPSDIDARERILNAATKLFTETPFDEVPAEEIARFAGVAHGLVFHYFRTKKRLYEEVSKGAADRLDTIHVEATRKPATASAKMRAFMEAHMDAVLRRRADYVFHSRGGATPAVQQIWENSRRNAILLVLGFLDVERPSPPLIVATRAWLGFFDELVLEWVQNRRMGREAVIALSTAVFSAIMKEAQVLGATDAPKTGRLKNE